MYQDCIKKLHATKYKTLTRRRHGLSKSGNRTTNRIPSAGTNARHRPSAAGPTRESPAIGMDLKHRISKSTSKHQTCQHEYGQSCSKYLANQLLKSQPLKWHEEKVHLLLSTVELSTTNNQARREGMIMTSTLQLINRESRDILIRIHYQG